MAKKQSPPLTEDEIRSVYRNEFYAINTHNYYNHQCTGSIRERKASLRSGDNTTKSGKKMKNYND